MNIVIIGTGNVATILGRKIKRAGHNIVQVYGRTPANAIKLAKDLSSSSITSFAEMVQDADIYIIAVSDRSISEIAGNMNLGNRIVVHTAGSVSADVLQVSSSAYGVLYPLQSLRAELDPLTEVPLLIECDNLAAKAVIMDLAHSISENVAEADDITRMKLHVGAVMTSNFTNHLYALTAGYCKREGLDFSLLYPLIDETAHRLRLFSPSDVQTGPAIRNDKETIARHLQLLEAYPALREIYILLTGSIQEKDNFAVPENKARRIK